MPRLQNAVILVLDQTAAAGEQAIASTFTSTMAFTIMDAMARVRIQGGNAGTITRVNNGGVAVSSDFPTQNTAIGSVFRTTTIATATRAVAVGSVLTTAIVQAGEALAIVDCFVTGFVGDTSLSQVP